jgi:hypothetical protein
MMIKTTSSHETAAKHLHPFQMHFAVVVWCQAILLNRSNGYIGAGLLSSSYSWGHPSLSPIPTQLPFI